MAQISPTRLAEMERKAAHDPALRFSIILTLKDGASAESVEVPGFQVEHRAFTIVTGSATVEAIKRLLEMGDTVALVEEDGEVRALSGSGS